MLRTWLVVALALVCSPLAAQSKSYRLKPVDLKQRVIWGSEASSSDGFKLAFGGMDQDALDGNPHTRVWQDGKWVSIAEELAKKSPLSKFWPFLASSLRATEVGYRHAYLADASGRDGGSDLFLEYRVARAEVRTVAEQCRRARAGLTAYEQQQIDHALKLLGEVETLLLIDGKLSPEVCVRLGTARQLAMQLEDMLAVEPPARALSPLVYEPHSRLFVLFGGDHLDYVSNDVWVFDPSVRQWRQRHPSLSPAPRADHKWEVLDGGKLKLTGGYTYTSSTDYCGGQYREVGDGAWIYDVASNTWSGEGKLHSGSQREFRTGALHPDFFLEGPRPNRQEFQTFLDKLPANTWVATKPPRKPQLNRDWGTAVLHPTRHEILRWSGGHSAHGGTDVLHYSTQTNRWLLTDPVEFPLGQLYTNTEYPDGVSFNGRAWITGHTYQSYACAPDGKMPFVGQSKQQFIYDPAQYRWLSPGLDKPKGMNYGDCFYTLTLCPTADKLYCWTQEGRVFEYQKDGSWSVCELTGEKLPGSSVDNSTLTYDSKRNRLLFFRKDYGDDKKYNGVIHTLDLKTKQVSKLTPENAGAASKVSYLCQLRYDEANDLVLCGCTLSPDKDGFRRTAAYDPETNRWVSLKITGEDPSGPKGRNVSLGMMYDAARKLMWATDTHCEVYVMRLERASADVLPLE